MANDKSWDSLLKRLIHVNPAAFVHWLIPGAEFLKERSQELESQKREVDALLEVIIDGQVVLLHIEFQTYHDATMAERLLLYNVLTRNAYKFPVLSCVIYLLKDGPVPQSPLVVTLAGRKKLLEFHFESIEMEQLTPEDILGLHNVALIPLLPLTKDGSSRTTLLRMFAELNEQREPNETEVQATELELIGFTLASLVLKRKNILDLEWLIDMFHEMHDIIREAPIFQEILREGQEEGHAKGLAEGREASVDMLLMLTHALFPSLVNILQKQVGSIQDLQTLKELASNISNAKTVDEAQAYILGLNQKFNA